MKSLLLLATMLFATTAFSAEETANIELSRYLGTWYEIARFDHFYERNCAGVTATYTKREDGDLKVVNRCIKGGLQGDVKKVEGKAWVPDPSQPGKLKVQFFWPFRGDYWVLEVAPDYSWALVGDPEKKSCWILSRTPALPQPLYDSLLEKLKARGYDTEKLIKVEQAKE